MGTTAEELRERLNEQRGDLSRDLEAIGDRVSPHRIVERKQAAASRKLSDMKERIMGVKDSGMHTAHDASAALHDTAHDAVERSSELTSGNPFAAGLVAFGAGLVAATLLPGSRVEQRAAERVQPLAEEAAAEVMPAARQVVDDVKPAAKQALSEVKERAADAVTQVKDEATSATDDIKTTAQREAGRARD